MKGRVIGFRAGRGQFRGKVGSLVIEDLDSGKVLGLKGLTLRERDLTGTGKVWWAEGKFFHATPGIMTYFRLGQVVKYNKGGYIYHEKINNNCTYCSRL